MSTRSSSVDVVVIGFGAAGIAAAITAHDEGAQVVVLEKAPPETAGGNTRAAGQVWYSPHDEELAKEYLRGLAYDMPIPDDVVDAWASEQVRNNDWMTARAAEAQGHIDVDPRDPFGQGVTFEAHTYQEAVKRQTGWDVPRDEFPEFNNEGGTEWVTFGGTQGHSRVWLRLKAALEQRDVEIRYSTAATAIVTDGDGRVTGVEVLGPDGAETITARRGVVNAAGGFENNPEMIRTYLGLPYVTPWGTPHNTGDGIRMGQALGADLQNMYQHMPMFGIALEGLETGEFVQPGGPAFIQVAQDGRRFISEATAYRHGKSTIGGRLEFYPHRAMWTVFDETVRTAGPLTAQHEAWAAGWEKQVVGYVWSDDNMVEIEKGWITKADTIRELAEKLGVDPDGLEAEIERWNAACAQGEDPYFGRPAEMMAPITEPPYYGYKWGNLLIATMGGLRKNGKAQVLHVSGQPIPGLYAAGEISSTFTWALGGGQSIADAIGFGRIAGREAAAG